VLSSLQRSAKAVQDAAALASEAVVVSNGDISANSYYDSSSSHL